MSIELAVIGGTGLYRFPGLEDIERHHVDTPYGKPSGDTVVGTIAGKRVAFMAAYVFLGLNGYDLDADEPDVVATMEGVASSAVTEAALAQWFRFQIVSIEE